MAAVLATKAATSAIGGLVRWVKEQLSPEAQAVLDAAIEAPEDEARVGELGRELERAEQADPEFGRELRERYDRANVEIHADGGSVVNQISGNVSGKVVQARDIQGNISF
ncbi:hypothetical protein [Allokutzneria sp. NRRL B-24872]|uniref:hypothetical protein n=1 Tax=Allokutzneria sp. NRRL B-24872 TaxID=1137961 RepID=UPI001FF0723D|nr:hypothetical protein [Allokutzneria sp. NRRL B-24872]